jgi:hypothetical protein
VLSLRRTSYTAKLIFSLPGSGSSQRFKADAVLNSPQLQKQQINTGRSATVRYNYPPSVPLCPPPNENCRPRNKLLVPIGGPLNCAIYVLYWDNVLFVSSLTTNPPLATCKASSGRVFRPGF